MPYALFEENDLESQIKSQRENGIFSFNLVEGYSLSKECPSFRQVCENCSKVNDIAMIEMIGLEFA